MRDWCVRLEGTTQNAINQHICRNIAQKTLITTT